MIAWDSVAVRDVYGPAVGYRFAMVVLQQWRWMRLDGDAKRGCERCTLQLWWHHRFMSVVLHGFSFYVAIYNSYCYVWAFISYGNGYHLWMM